MRFPFPFKSIFLLFALASLSTTSAQSISINNTGNTPDPSSMLDVQSNTKGILIPRINLDNVTTSMLDGVTQAAIGLLIFNTNASTTGGSGIGYYTWTGSSWEKLITSSSGVVDVDFYEEGSTSPPNDINDDLYTLGNLGIGKAIVDYPLDIESKGIRGINTVMNGNTNEEVIGNYTENASTGSGRHIGSYNSITGTGTGVQYGSFQMMANTADATQYGSFSSLSGSGNVVQYGTSNSLSSSGIGFQYGSYSTLVGDGDGEQYGSYQWISNRGAASHYGNFNLLSGEGTGQQYGIRNEVSNNGDGSHYGTSNRLTGDGNGQQLGTLQEITNSGSGEHFGARTILTGDGDGNHYGISNTLFNDGNGLQYGGHNLISNTGSGDKYATFNQIDFSGDGIKYGTYQDVTASGTSHSYGSYNIVSASGLGSTIGSEQDVRGSGDGLHYGQINRLAGNGNGNQFGIFNTVTNTGSGNKYGTFNLISGALPGTHFGIYSSVPKAESFAGYFFGNVYVGRDFVSGPKPILQVSGGSDASYLDGSGDLAIGELDEANVVFDVNEILARNNGSSSPLYIQRDGGNLLLAADEAGAVGIGVGLDSNMPNGFLLAVDGDIIAEDIVIAASGTWPDYVFEEDYELKDLRVLEKEISDLGHLPGMPSAEEVKAEGFAVGDIQKKLLEKIEELTLYMIAMDKEVKILNIENEALKKKLQNLKNTKS